MDDSPGSAAWVNSKTVLEFLLEEEAQGSYPREIAWIRDKLPKNIEVRRQMFRSRPDHSVDMTLAGFTYLLACRRWPEGGYSPDEYAAIALSAGKVFPAMAAHEKVKSAAARRADDRLNEGGRKLVPATDISRNQIFISIFAALKQLGGWSTLGSKQTTNPSGEPNMPEAARPRP